LAADVYNFPSDEMHDGSDVLLERPSLGLEALRGQKIVLVLVMVISKHLLAITKLRLFNISRAVN